MGAFTAQQKAVAGTVYQNMKPYLKSKDGKVHVALVNSFSKFLNQHFGCDDKYTNQIDELLSCMQDDGYEIIDFKLTTLKGQGVFGSLEGYSTLIVYK